jgi:hypothetical protein
VTCAGAISGSASPSAFLPSTDLDRSRQFFADKMGLVGEEVTPFACVVRVGTTMLRGADRIAWFRDPDGNILSLTQFVPC